MLDIAGEEIDIAAPSTRTPAEDDTDPFLELLVARLSHTERAEVAWLAGRTARDVGGCARRRAEEIAGRLGADPGLVADGARTEGRLDERACMLLGVPQDATRDQVRRAYRSLAAQFHPDGLQALERHQRKQAEDAFIRIRNAYEQLMRELGENP